MARIFKVGFDYVWGKADEAPPRQFPEVRGDTPTDFSLVAARDAEEAIRKLRESAVGYRDEDEDVLVIGVVIHSVVNVGELDIA